MDDISIKILDALFDLCDGENFVILEKDDLTSRISFHEFATDELTEILEALSADGLIDLKYADNHEFCVAMKTKGRSLIKQSRDRLQRLIEENPEVVRYREEMRAAEEDRQEQDALREEKEMLLRKQEDKLAEARANLEEAVSPEEKAASKEELRRVKADIRREREHVADLDDRIRAAGEREAIHTAAPLPNLARGYSPHADRANAEEEEYKRKQRDKKVFLAALVGGAVGALIMNVIFLIVYFVKVMK